MGAYLYAGWETWWWKPGGSEVFLLADWWTGLCKRTQIQSNVIAFLLLLTMFLLLVSYFSLTEEAVRNKLPSGLIVIGSDGHFIDFFSCLKFSPGPVFQCVNSSVFYWAAWIRGESQFLSFSVHALSVVAQTDLVHIFSSIHSNVFLFRLTEPLNADS